MEWPLASRILDLEAAAYQVAGAGVISPSDLAEWLRNLVERDKAKRFFSAMAGFTVNGRKP
jgi:hypothetical protein